MSCSLAVGALQTSAGNELRANAHKATRMSQALVLNACGGYKEIKGAAIRTITQLYIETQSVNHLENDAYVMFEKSRLFLFVRAEQVSQCLEKF